MAKQNVIGRLIRQNLKDKGILEALQRNTYHTTNVTDRGATSRSERPPTQIHSHATIVLVNGGLESTALLSYWTHWSHATELLPLFINYGQVNAVRQQEAATAVCQHLQLPPLAVVKVAALAGLYSGMQRGEERHRRASFRNLMLVTLGASVAAEQGASHIALAVNKEHHEARSEDATLSFLGRAESVLHSLEPPISLLTPFIHLTTPQVVQLVAEQANAPLDLTWSCKGGGEKHCGVCLGCRVRKEALESL